MTRIAYLTEADLAQVERVFPQPRVNKIVQEVSDATGIPVKAILSPKHTKEVCLARAIVCYVAHRAGISSPDIGKAIGRDHSSVLNLIGREKARRGE
jgi:chromosomal replication initiation ATPase DnaA